MARSILHIFPSFGIGGQQRRLVDLIAAFGDQVRHEIVSLDEDLGARALLPAGTRVDVRALPLAKSGVISPTNIQMLRHVMIEANPGHLCTYNWGSMEAVLAWRSLRNTDFSTGKRPIHLHFEDGFGPDESLSRQHAKRVLARRMALARSMVVVPSFGLEVLARERWKLAPERVRRLGNGIDLARFSVARPALSAGDPVVVGSVGAFRREKRFDRLIEAAQAVATKHLCTVTLVGDGPELPMLKNLAARVQDDLTVSLPGATRVAEEWYAKFDIFMMSSETEQMPISLMEAMAAGLPVIATRVGDIDRMISDENKPFIVENGDLDGLAAALGKLVADADLRQRLGAANARKAMADFGRERMITDYSALFGLT
ncbi:MAG: glycosyltransferase family 4 protein [Pseudomonadota bacterium]